MESPVTPSSAELAVADAAEETRQFARLMAIIRTLRSPGGCSWDRKQTHETMRKYLLEEAQEVAAAIEQGHPLPICEELGDLLMTIAMQARIAEEAGTFTMTEVLRGISDKLIGRHPHVFGEAERGLSPDRVVDMWGKLKAEEKRQRSRLTSRMEEAARFASALRAAVQIQAEAATVGFDFPDRASAVAKIFEEAEELRADLENGSPAAQEAELGDLLFSIVNVARLLGLDPDAALRQANQKFIRRFARLEDRFEQQGGLAGRSIAELDAVWNEIKQAEPERGEPAASTDGDRLTG
ncbi:MAG: Nucleoside triphosphate pyrophosphohydrolase MazG [Candidatus Ozemobacter sibiricus]|jgi:MazG family protein|uniref:Nucleoside triphosphate pyrophosphohydrolase MazG n=1 Tax=Candidatus Ozemobacter sibiricus TaxID=2268124 RepID=A0A367ZNW4_9BACT|nr:MAG: Nucleoside triphosphate pyrophosphohydrolase MazG [Candidatus Ozemobacter sibiricus]